MKSKYLLAAPFVLAISACDPTGESISGSGIDPLRQPAGAQSSNSYGVDLRPGQFVSAAVENTAFYKAKPKQDQEADKLLSQGTPMKIVAISGNHIKVELDSGEVGFVPSVMISTGEAEAAALDGGLDTLVPIVPLDSELPLPVADPDETTPETPPAVIEPDASAE
jgi:uncharacterized protein YwbE